MQRGVSYGPGDRILLLASYPSEAAGLGQGATCLVGTAAASQGSRVQH